jgi:hypothetical protein
LKNSLRISNSSRDYALEWVKISMVVQENNFMEMSDFVRLGKRFDFDTVYFGQLVNWGTFSEAEFANRAIHLPGHPRHKEFLDLLKNEIFDEPLVDLGNLTATRNPAKRLPTNDLVRFTKKMWATVRNHR